MGNKSGKRGGYRKRKFNNSHKVGTRSQYNDNPPMRGPFKNYVKGDPFPPRQLVRLVYSEAFQFTSGTAGVFGTQQAMNLNSIYDPNNTGAGHQPYGHDQLATLYNKYKVIGVKVQLRWTDPSVDGLMCGAVVLPQGGTFSMTGTTQNRIKELPMSYCVQINDSGSQVKTVTQYFPINKVLGITKQQFNSDTLSYTANMGANPSAIPKLLFSMTDLNGTSGSTVRCQCTLTYYTMVYDRLIQGQS